MDGAVASNAAGRDSSLRRFLAQVGLEFRRGEAGPAILLFLTFFLLVTFQYTTKTVRQATFINVLGAEKLPYVYLFIAVASFPVLRLYARLADRVRRDVLVAWTYAFVAVTMVVFWWLFQFASAAVSFAFYVWIAISVVMLVSQFWSLANHMFDARQAKRLFAFIGAGGLLGSVLGGQIAHLATKFVSTRSALLGAAAILVIVPILIRLAHRTNGAGERNVSGPAEPNEALSGFEMLRQSRHLQWLAAMTVLTVMVGQIVDLQFNWAVQRATSSLEQRTAFFGNFYSVMGIVAFVFQILFTARILRTLGVGFSIRVLPATVAVGTIALIAAATGAPEMLIAAAVVLKAGENGARYSLDQSARELLYLPIPSRARLKVKTFIDVSVQRAAEGIAALLLLPVTFGVMTPPQAGSMSLALVGVWLAATIFVRREYVDSFRAGLKKRHVAARVLDLNDATALEVVLQSLSSSDARQVLHAVQLLEHHDPKLVPALMVHHEAAAVRRAVLRVFATADRLDALPLVERCLSDSDAGVRREAVAALARLRRTDVRSLMVPYLTSGDAMLVSAAVVALHDADGDLRVRAGTALASLIRAESAVARAEAAKALGYLDSNDHADGLTVLLHDSDPEVVRETITAVRRRTFRHGPNPMFVPALISLLDNRRLKHEARRALVTFGEAVIPALAHFMTSPDERLWVRRALPKTIALIGGPSAIEALAESLRQASDSFLVRKIIESLATVTSSNSDLGRFQRDIVATIASQSAHYFRALALLAALGSAQRGRLAGMLVTWDDEEYQPGLLEKLLCERMAGAVRNIFGLLALLHDREHIHNSYRSVTSGEAGLVANAVEYLDNVLTAEVRECVLPIIDELSLGARLRIARDRFGIAVPSRVDVLAQIVNDSLEEQGEGAAWGAAALYEVYATRTARLDSHLANVRKSERADPLLRETAEWISRRLESGVAGH